MAGDGSPSSRASRDRCFSGISRPEQRTSLSRFEQIISTHPPVLESLLLQLPTSSILDLYHTSNHLRSFLQSYPTAWNHLSFRSFSPGRLTSRQASPASDSSAETSAVRSKPYALDQLLMAIVLPFGTRLISLDLDHTAVAGDTLTSLVLHSRRETLQHLSVRGCKQVSLKYNIMPFLTLFSLQKPAGPGSKSGPVRGLALRSLYTFRCRHHRRRPYTPTSLLRKDSDSVHTHEFIKICHQLGIWTDTAWCPTPGGRCLKRKDYSVGRGTPDARTEVWVVYDRLWRSGNRLGPAADTQAARLASTRGQLWEDAEFGYDGEPLGCEPQQGRGEGKSQTAHLRHSHRKFIENVTCQDCKARIPERCEHCSIRMHCMGCRKTLCENCAFSRPLPLVKSKKSTSLETDDLAKESYWWAPGQMRNPNLMMQEVAPSTSAANSNAPNSTVTPALNIQWCCLKPMFSNGGSITFVGPGMTGSAVNHVHTAPLPPGEGYEDAELGRLRQSIKKSASIIDCPALSGSSPKLKHYQKLHWLLYGMCSEDRNPCPRSLCNDCWQTPGWRAACQSCSEPFCFAHDLRGLSMRICGYKDLSSEKAFLEENTQFRKALKASEQSTIALNIARDRTDGTIRECLEVLSKITELSQSFKDKYAPLLDLASKGESGTLLSRSGEILCDLANELKETPHEGELLKELDLIASRHISSSNKERTERTEDRLTDSWRGCGSFLCPKYRSIGDHRPRCTASAQQCYVCEVHVCPDCLAKNPHCDCAYCKDHYSCPSCAKTLGGLCTKAEEEEEVRRKARVEEEQHTKWKHQVKEANDMAELAQEFLAQSVAAASETERMTMCV